MRHDLFRKALCLILALLLMLALPALAEDEQQPGQELLKDADFSGPLRFQLYTESGGAAKLAIVDGELQVDVTSVGRVEHAIQPYYDGFKLIQGVTYELSWDARSTVPREMQVRIQLNGGDYHAYVMPSNIILTGTRGIKRLRKSSKRSMRRTVFFLILSLRRSMICSALPAWILRRRQAEPARAATRGRAEVLTAWIWGTSSEISLEAASAAAERQDAGTRRPRAATSSTDLRSPSRKRRSERPRR